jgi:hypothetical protein
MTTEEKLLAEAKTLKPSDKLRLALMSELVAAYYMGKRGVPQDRLKDFVMSAATTYSYIISRNAIRDVMECVMEHKAPIELVMLEWEQMTTEYVDKEVPILQNIRQAILADYKATEEK